MKNKAFSYFCFGLLCFCLFIILWGAWVRISHSGDGCGQSWPSCHGNYIMDADTSQKTWTEWFHRASSGLFGIFVLALVIWAKISFPFKSAVSKSAFCVLLLTITEALIGARLVLAGLTGGNSSLNRTLTMHAHLLNSLLLTSSIFLCWRFSLNKKFSFFKTLFSKIFTIFFLIIALFGSVSALASSLFPSTSLSEGLLMDFQSDSHPLIRWRWVHPFLALSLGGVFLYYFLFWKKKSERKKLSSYKYNFFLILLAGALISGTMNLALLSPTLLKLFHLFIVYMLLFSFIWTQEKTN